MPVRRGGRALQERAAAPQSRNPTGERVLM